MCGSDAHEASPIIHASSLSHYLTMAFNLTLKQNKMRLKELIEMVGRNTFVQHLPKASLMSANVIKGT